MAKSRAKVTLACFGRQLVHNTRCGSTQKGYLSTMYRVYSVFPANEVFLINLRIIISNKILLDLLFHLRRGMRFKVASPATSITREVLEVPSGIRIISKRTKGFESLNLFHCEGADFGRQWCCKDGHFRYHRSTLVFLTYESSVLH